MLKQVLIIVFIAGGVQTATAAAAPEELSKCLALKNLAIQHESWKSEFRQKRLDDTFTHDRWYKYLTKSLDNELTRLVSAQSIAGFKNSNRGLIDETSEILATLDDQTRTQSAKRHLMTNALPKVQDALDDVIYRAQFTNEACDINPSPRRTSKNAPRGAK